MCLADGYERVTFICFMMCFSSDFGNKKYTLKTGTVGLKLSAAWLLLAICPLLIVLLVSALVSLGASLLLQVQMA